MTIELRWPSSGGWSQGGHYDGSESVISPSYPVSIIIHHCYSHSYGISFPPKIGPKFLFSKKSLVHYPLPPSGTAEDIQTPHIYRWTAWSLTWCDKKIPYMKKKIIFPWNHLVQDFHCMTLARETINCKSYFQYAINFQIWLLLNPLNFITNWQDKGFMIT